MDNNTVFGLFNEIKKSIDEVKSTVIPNTDCGTRGEKDNPCPLAEGLGLYGVQVDRVKKFVNSVFRHFEKLIEQGNSEIMKVQDELLSLNRKVQDLKKEITLMRATAQPHQTSQEDLRQLRGWMKWVYALLAVSLTMNCLALFSSL